MKVLSPITETFIDSVIREMTRIRDLRNGAALISFLFLSSVTNAQWFHQTSGTPETLRSVYFVNDSLGYIVGDGGTILKTENGGTNWISQTSNTLLDLSSVFFINSNKGFAVGDSGLILKTMDGGATWNIQYEGAEPISQVLFTTNDSGFIVTLHEILRTTDGGNTWASHASLNAGGNISFPDANTGYEYGCGEELKTTDGGTTWVLLVNHACVPTQLPIFDIYFPEQNTGYAVGGGDHYGYIGKTIDGASTWINMGGTSGYGVLDAVFFAVYFTSPDTGYVVGSILNPFYVGGDGGIINTVDGQTWQIQENNIVYTPLAVYFPSKKTGYTVGRSGLIMKTTNGGGIYNETDITINPNPSTGSAIIQFPDDWKDKSVEIRIYDIVGRKIKKLETKNVIHSSVSIENLRRGMYIYQALESNKVIAKGKFIVD